MTCNMIFDFRKMEVVSGITKKAELPLENVNGVLKSASSQYLISSASIE